MSLEALFDVPWREMLMPSVSPLEMFLRGTIVYLFILALLRLFLRRQPGTVGISDLLVIVLLADAAQNGMAGDYASVTDGALLVGTIIFWSYVLDWLGYRIRSINRLIFRRPVLLVLDGRPIKAALDRELLTEDELMSALRQQGVLDISQVSRAYIESNGQISVVTREQERHNRPEPPVV